MAEVCSAYPTAGGLYWWAGRLARSNKRVWAWYVGWFNFLGEVAVTAAIDFGAAITWMALLNLVFGLEVTHDVDLRARSSVIMLLHGLLNTFGVNLVKLLSDVSAWWHLVGVAVIVGVLAIVPDQHQSPAVDLHRVPQRDRLGAAPHLRLPASACSWRSTPTPATTPRPTSPRRPSAPRVEAPKGIVRSVWVSIIAGWVLLIAVTAAIQDYAARARRRATGLPPAQIFIDAAGQTVGRVPAASSAPSRSSSAAWPR